MYLFLSSSPENNSRRNFEGREVLWHRNRKLCWQKENRSVRDELRACWLILPQGCPTLIAPIPPTYFLNGSPSQLSGIQLDTLRYSDSMGLALYARTPVGKCGESSDKNSSSSLESGDKEWRHQGAECAEYTQVTLDLGSLKPMSLHQVHRCGISSGK